MPHPDVREDTIATDKAASWVYAEGFAPEDDTLLRARDRAGELGCTPVQPGTGAALTVLAAAARARAVVEVGTGAGVSGLHLLRGMLGRPGAGIAQYGHEQGGGPEHQQAGAGDGDRRAPEDAQHGLEGSGHGTAGGRCARCGGEDGLALGEHGQGTGRSNRVRGRTPSRPTMAGRRLRKPNALLAMLWKVPGSRFQVLGSRG